MAGVGLNKVFVEGKSDKLFIDAILYKYFEIADTEIVVDTKGKGNLKSQPDLTNARRKDEKAKNLLIFDTDYDNEKYKGGRNARIKEYEAIAKELNIGFEIYLLPFNNDHDGILEDLLNTCLKKDFAFFDGCWNSMIDCLIGTDFENLNVPAQKAFVYSKIDLFKNYRQREWGYHSSSIYDYFDSGIWDLNKATNPDLNSLVLFIEENLFNK